MNFKEQCGDIISELDMDDQALLLTVLMSSLGTAKSYEITMAMAEGLQEVRPEIAQTLRDIAEKMVSSQTCPQPE